MISAIILHSNQNSGTTSFWCVADIPHIIPGGITFGELHRFHHAYLNEAYDDPDVPLPIENKFFGQSRFGKFMWMLLFPLVMALRQAFATSYMLPSTKKFKLFTEYHMWIVVNWILNISINLTVFYFLGIRAMVFIFVSFLFALGLHPLGARWIAEHYSIHPGQETFSYYGSLNLVSFNIGFHVEHHDFPSIPWAHLPKITKIAPEYYSHLRTHKSYVRLLIDFICEGNFTLETRMVRPSHRINKLDKASKKKYEQEFLHTGEKKGQ
eukprot:TRINITY_DN1792_c0_g1_i1.p1 TRINITY_DN1792_c0_g1~~TRINITY_DN1792_c0_g1_i1.p1  ORF type:complete len:267 (-),score=16.37 TRINITY_DN1792_c0_g1_i1:139-939(-)